jgi:hypothetical protein
MTREELYKEAITDRGSAFINMDTYHSIIRGNYKLVKELKSKEIGLYKLRGEYYEPANIENLLEKGWKKGLKELNLKKNE